MLHLSTIRSTVPAILAGLALFSATSTFAAKAVPYRGGGEAQIISNTPNPDGSFAIMAESFGYSTHQGRYHAFYFYTFGFALNEDGVLVGVVTGVGVAASANGDELWLEFNGGADLAGNFWGSTTVVGGTGRFQNASGCNDYVGADGLPGTFSYEFEGVISTVGSNKK